jgi:hypothetical protein
MSSKLSYYSLFLLIGLVIVSALVLAMNPFNSVPASASPASQNVATSSAASGISHPISNSPASSTPAGNLLGNGTQPGGSFGGLQHHSDEFPGIEGAAGNRTTSTTSTGTIHSVDE